ISLFEFLGKSISKTLKDYKYIYDIFKSDIFKSDIFSKTLLMPIDFYLLEYVENYKRILLKTHIDNSIVYAISNVNLAFFKFIGSFKEFEFSLENTERCLIILNQVLDTLRKQDPLNTCGKELQEICRIIELFTVVMNLNSPEILFHKFGNISAEKEKEM